MYITKENLIKELDNLNSKIAKQPVRPLAYLIVLIGVILTIFLIMPIIFLWLLLIILYIPGFLIENAIIYIRRKIK